MNKNFSDDNYRFHNDQNLPLYFGANAGLFACLLAVFMLVFINDAVAANAGRSQLSDKVSRQLLFINKLMDQNQYQEAQKRLLNIVEKSRLHTYEAAVIYQSLGYVYAENDDHKNTVKAFEKSLALNVLSPRVQQSLRLNLGQLYMSLGDYQKGTKILETWRKKENKTSWQIHELLAVGYYHQRQYSKSIKHVEKILENESDVSESYYQLAIALYFELSNFQAANQLLRQVVKRFPDEKNYWRQLAYSYRELNKTEEAIATLTLAKHKGLLNSADILVLAQLYIGRQLPYQAAELIQTELKKGKLENRKNAVSLLARSWRMAQELEQAAMSYENLAAYEKHGKALYQQAQVFVELRHWKPAITALQKALDKGVGEDEGRAYLLLGVARYETGQFNAANRTLQKASQFKKLKLQAQQWLQMVETAQQEQKQYCELSGNPDCSILAIR